MFHVAHSLPCYNKEANTNRLDVCTVTWDAMGADLGFEYEFLNNSYAAGLAGMTIGSIFFIPAAMIFGRKPVYLFAALTMVLVNVGQARFQTRVQFIVLQVLAGLAGSINDTIIQMTVRSLVSMPKLLFQYLILFDVDIGSLLRPPTGHVEWRL